MAKKPPDAWGSAFWVLKLQDRSGWDNNSTMLLRAKQRKAKKRVIQSCSMLCVLCRSKAVKRMLHTRPEMHTQRSNTLLNFLLGPKMQKKTQEKKSWHWRASCCNLTQIFFGQITQTPDRPNSSREVWFKMAETAFENFARSVHIFFVSGFVDDALCMCV